MKKYLIILSLILLLILVSSCKIEKNQIYHPLVGNDSDEQGCKASAGYQWCEEKQKCLRTWEEECKIN